MSALETMLKAKSVCPQTDTLGGINALNSTVDQTPFYSTILTFSSEPENDIPTNKKMD